MITRENIAEIIPEHNKRMTQEEFYEARKLKNKDIDFSDMLKKYSNLDDVSDELKKLFADNTENFYSKFEEKIKKYPIINEIYQKNVSDCLNNNCQSLSVMFWVTMEDINEEINDLRKELNLLIK